jgi:hypothetical protein
VQRTKPAIRVQCLCPHCGKRHYPTTDPLDAAKHEAYQAVRDAVASSLLSAVQAGAQSVLALVDEVEARKGTLAR